MDVDAAAAGLDEGRLERIGHHLRTRYIEPGKIAGAQVAILFTKLPKSVENPRFDEAALRDGEYGRNSGGG